MSQAVRAVRLRMHNTELKVLNVEEVDRRIRC